MDKIIIPPNARFIGYICHLPRSDEFLARSKNMGIAVGYAWSKTPEMARIFTTRAKAEKQAKEYGKDIIVMELFETDQQYLISLPERQISP